ncbi:hypothetical protein [Burkholderia gladioli]|uniref:hypothetical protein n=1 Tax=Burkholderia gladioli TaxID=28095 RepID=UPI001EE63D3A|nr:hypothetical protein [Burkholderia gladioli]
MLGAIRREYTELPFIVLTNMTNTGLLRAMLLGIVAKGAERSELQATVQAVMSGSDYVNNKLRHKLAKFGTTSAESHTAAPFDNSRVGGTASSDRR